MVEIKPCRGEYGNEVNFKICEDGEALAIFNEHGKVIVCSNKFKSLPAEKQEELKQHAMRYRDRWHMRVKSAD